MQNSDEDRRADTQSSNPPSSARPRPRRLGISVAIALLSAAMLGYELDLIRLLSFRTWYHFAFVVLSVAVLGVGASGTIAQVRPSLIRPASRAAGYALLFSASAIGAFFLLRGVDFDSIRAARHPSEWWVLLVYEAVFTVPFASGGLALIALFGGAEEPLPRLYSADLLGGGVGAFGTAAALSVFGAVRLVFVVALLGAIAAGLLGWALGSGGASARHRRWLWACAAAIGGMSLIGTAGGERLISLAPGPGKALSALQRIPGARMRSSEDNALSRVDVVDAPVQVEWTRRRDLEAQRPIAMPSQTQILIDGDAATPVLHLSSRPPTEGDELQFLDSMLSSAAAQALRPHKVLVIGAGGGIDVLAALRNGAQEVDAIEVNPTIVRLMRKDLAPLTHAVYERPGVRLVEAEARSFVSRGAGGYDAIQLSLVDTWAASSQGAFSLVEAHLYTVEAFEAYLRLLNPKGVLTVTRWLQEPPRESLRLCTIAIAALRSAGVASAQSHVVVLVAGPLATVLVKRSPFDAAELARVLEVAESRHFRIAHAPGMQQNNPFSTLLTSASPADFIRSYPYDISASTDERPYFFQSARSRSGASVPSIDAWAPSGAVSGRGLVLVVLAQVAILAAALLLLPALFGRKRHMSGPEGIRRPLAAHGYFFCIGIGFMLLEIGLVQRLTLFLGPPAAAISVGLGALLIGAGLGSRAVSWLPVGGNAPTALLGVLVLVAATHTTVLPDVLDAAVGLDFNARVAVGLLASALLGVAMGVGFPLGVVNGCAEPIGLAWAWAGNGAASALGPVVGTLIALDFGTTALMIAGSSAYAVALMLYLVSRRLT